MAGLTLAPSIDQPTVTFASLGASAVPNIVGSAGWFREKRIGVAENTPGGTAQVSTADLDLTGSTRFRYPGLPAATGYAANAGQYVNSGLKPGGSTQAANWPFNVEFTTSSPTVEIRMNAPVTNPGTGRILVNGLPIVDVTTSITSTATAGGGYGMKLAFSTSAPRTITLIALNNTVGRFGGVAVEGGYTVTKPSDTITSIAFLGDSYVNGASPVGIVDTFAWRTASILGYGRNVILAGIGGTGYQTMIGSDPNSLMVNRVASMMAMSPNIVVLDAGRNDSSSGQQAAVEAVIDAITALGSPTIYVTNSSSNSSQAAVNTAMQAAAASRGKIWFTSDVDSLPKLGDAVHPTQAGHVTLADATVANMTPSSAFSGSVSLSGSGTLTASGAVALSGTLGLSGSGTLTLSGTKSTTGTLALSGSGTLTASGKAAVGGTLALSGTGTLSLAGGNNGAGIVNLSGSGTLSLVQSGMTVGGTLALTGSGVLSASGTATQGPLNLTGSIALSGSGTLGLVGVAVTGGLVVEVAREVLRPSASITEMFGRWSGYTESDLWDNDR